MSNFTKHYTKNGEKYKADFQDHGRNYEIHFGRTKKGSKILEIFECRSCYDTPEFDKFIEDGGYEEVVPQLEDCLGSVGQSISEPEWRHNGKPLPEEPTNAKNAQVEEVKQELKNKIAHYRSYVASGSIAEMILNDIQVFLNALDEQDSTEKMIDSIAKVKNEKFADEVRSELANNKIEKPLADNKSIWRDVSELPEITTKVYLRLKSGRIQEALFYEPLKHFEISHGIAQNLESIKEYCTLTDFINQHNSLEERVKKLEGK